MPFVTIGESPMLPGISPVRLHYREVGNGAPLVFMHGGWGYEVYPFQRQIEEFGNVFRILIPDRCGYGLSMRVEHVAADFHQRAAVEMMRFLDALNVQRPVLWGHSDGAVIAAIMGLAAPFRFRGLILEAFHYDRRKNRSREFFESMVRRPESLGERVCGILAREHGEDYWKKLLVEGGRAWLKICENGNRPETDFYGGRLSELSVPTIFIHGTEDPRTEPGEIEAVRAQLPGAPIRLIKGAGHSPHSETASSERCNQLVQEFLEKMAAGRRV